MASRKKSIETDVYSLTAFPGWENAKLVGHTEHDFDRKVVIPIRNPWQLQHVRQELDKIQALWEKRLQEGRQ